jgi:hypothetical protein
MRAPLAQTAAATAPGLRKSVRFELAVSPIVVQISGVSDGSISMVFGPVNRPAD